MTENIETNQLFRKYESNLPYWRIKQQNIEDTSFVNQWAKFLEYSSINSDGVILYQVLTLCHNFF